MGNSISEYCGVLPKYSGLLPKYIFGSYEEYGIEMLNTNVFTNVFTGAPQIKDMDRDCNDVEHGHRHRGESESDEYVWCSLVLR